MSALTAIILAGGLGTRLRSVVSDRPKVLAEVGGRPFVVRLLEQLTTAPVKNIVLCTGHLGEQVEATLGTQYQSIPLTYSREESPLGTAGAIRRALPHVQSDPVLVLNGDSYCECDLAALIEFHRTHAARDTLCLRAVEDTSRYGRVGLDSQDRILAFDEKGVSGRGWINAGIYLLARSTIENIPSGRAVSIERETFPRLLGQGLFGFRTRGTRFIDIGTPDSYAAAAGILGC